MATGPKLATDPIELLTNKNLTEPTVLSKWYTPVTIASVGFCAIAFGNWASKRPLMSGIQKHISFAVGGFFLGRYLDDYRAGYFAEKDAALRHYIQLHPEDFPPFERKKYGDILQPWMPIR